MPSSSLGFSFTVSGIAKTVTAGQAFVNVNWNVNPIGKVTLLSQNDIALAHYASEPLRAAKDLLSARYDHVIGQGIPVAGAIQYYLNKPHNNRWFSVSGPSFSFPSTNVIVTGIFNGLGEPLFWRHEIATTSTDKVQVVDSRGNSVNSSLYQVLKEVDDTSSAHPVLRVVVAHSLEYDVRKNEVYYVIYPEAGTGKTKREILNHRPLFKPATTSTYPHMSSQTDGAHLLVYFTSEELGDFSIELPSDYVKTAFMMTEESFVHAALPKALAPNEPWFIQIPKYKWKSEPLRNVTYHVPEWSNQSFYPWAPYRVAEDDVASIVHNEFIEVTHKGILSSLSLELGSVSFSQNIHILLYRENEELPSRAITNDATLDGIVADVDAKIFWEYRELSVNFNKGLIHVPFNLDSYAWCHVDYAYESHDFEFYEIDVNPFRNLGLVSQTLVLYTVPKHNIQTRSIEWLLYDEDGIVTACSQDGSTSNPSISTDAIGRVFRYKDPDSASGTTNSLAFSIAFAESFVGKYVNDTTNRYFILGEFAFRESLEEEGVSIVTDVRTEDVVSPLIVAGANPHRLSTLRDSPNTNLIALPGVSKVQGVRVHWALLDDYISSRLFGKDDIEGRLLAQFPAEETPVLLFDGVPWLTVSDVNVDGSTVTLSWFPVPSLDNNTPVKGLLYYGDLDNISTQVGPNPFANLARETTYAFSLSGIGTTYVQMRPYVTVNGVDYYGPKSNILKISLE